ncbi:cysteine--tRNA ligase [Striga asiatica]|uniref:Cysteine--tRNA ligase n=1 Tax=Striga asiatica TaxID=4170 RepID=A0A5A7PAP4_STRAF|nr:cysteine--tRNA ligase [Striga asiatica]
MAERSLDFQLYNSMTKQKEVFKPRIEGRVGMYVCGVTSYDLSHIGHARAYVAFDVLYRYLKRLGYDVVYVRNFTDVDDKCGLYSMDLSSGVFQIIRRANEVGEDPIALSGRFCQEFVSDMADLQCLLPTHQPLDDFLNYGILSGRKLEDNRAGERVAVDGRKRNPADFALLQSQGSPNGRARGAQGGQAGILNAVQSSHYLTHAFDIHGGGMDLIFPHHENEIAQSCAACPESKISYWLHNGFVTANEEKMSKSLGNFFTIREVTKMYHPLALRYFLLGTHYRSPVNYSISQIEIASDSVFYLYQTLEESEDALSEPKEETEGNAKPARIGSDAHECIKKLRKEFEAKLADDLHTPTILTSSLQEALRFMNTCLTKLKLNVGQLFDRFLEQLKDKALKSAGVTQEEVLQCIEERTLARRSDLVAKGIALMDIGKDSLEALCARATRKERFASSERELA